VAVARGRSGDGKCEGSSAKFDSEFPPRRPALAPPLDCEAAREARVLSGPGATLLLELNFMERRIAVVGLGCVGLPAAVAFGPRGKIVGFAVERAAAGYLVFGR
jgi:hypothetical protein